jgi:hypothetical protein
VRILKDPSEKEIETYRTGWIPSYLTGETVKFNKRDEEGNDTFICFGKCIEIIPIQYKDLPEAGKQEAQKYGRDFHAEHYFFKEVFRKIYNIKKYI